MVRIAFAAALLCPLAGLAAPAPRARPQDARAILGVWKAERWEHEGLSTSRNEVRHIPSVEVTASSITIQEGPRAYPMWYTLRPSRSPAHIDLVYSDGPDKGKTVKGLYELKGDTLTLCVAPAGEGRPRSLATKEGEKVTLYVLERSRRTE